jgi:hypothetical protein
MDVILTSNGQVLDGTHTSFGIEQNTKDFMYIDPKAKKVFYSEIMIQVTRYGQREPKTKP